MVADYNNSKIYTIRSRSRSDLVYVGSTTQALSVRFAGHKCGRTCSSKQILDIGDSYIELYVAYPCNNREELNRKEGEVMRSMNCINKCLAGRTKKEYRIDNKEESKEYREIHREKILHYNDTHREEFKQYRVNEKNIQTCICGSIYNYGKSSHRKRHYRSQKHQLHLDNVYKIIRGE
jgi:hypothetical protein